MTWLAYNYGTVSDIEIAWTAIAVIGVCFSFYNVRDAWADYRVTRAIPNGRALVAEVGLRVESLRLTIQTIFIAIGIAAMFVAEPPPPSELPTAQVIAGTIFRWGLMVSATLVMVQSIENRRLRQALLEQLPPIPEKGGPA